MFMCCVCGLLKVIVSSEFVVMKMFDILRLKFVMFVSVLVMLTFA